MFSHFFIRRPIFAAVISIVIVVLGLWSVAQLPIAQYPEIAPPTVEVKTTYPGADAQTVAETVAAEIEKEVNGVEDSIYLSSTCTNDGQYTLTVTFRVGTDLDMAQVLVQNRVSIALAKLPEEVTRQGVTTKKKSPSLMLCVNLISPDGTKNTRELSEIATTRVKDELARLEGVGDVVIFGERETSMRIWLDPDELAARSLTPTDIGNAIREQNIQVAAGRLGQQPAPKDETAAFQYSLRAKGRLLTRDEFGGIIVKTGAEGQLVYLRDVAEIELGAKNYDLSSTLDGRPTITLGIFQLPGSNAIDAAQRVRETMASIDLLGSGESTESQAVGTSILSPIVDGLKNLFGIKTGQAETEATTPRPEPISYEIAYDTTGFIQESVDNVVQTLIEAIALVLIVLFVFLQDWRTTLIPAIAVPVSLVGTLAIMLASGFSLNNLSLFGLVLAIGIVVDDAIVVVENTDRKMEGGLRPKEAAKEAMTEVASPVIATTLVLISVFVPTALVSGITGQFYRQFALTIAAATVISSINALTLSPALCGVLLRPRIEGERREPLPGVFLAFLLGAVGIWGIGPMIPKPDAEWLQWILVILPGVVGAVLGAFTYKLMNALIQVGFRLFNIALDAGTSIYTLLIKGMIRLSLVVLLIYGVLVGATAYGFRVVPTGFIPTQDKGYLVVNAQLPDAASLNRTEDVINQISEIALQTPGVAHTLAIPGYSALSASNSSNSGTVFVVLEPFRNEDSDAEGVGRSGDPSRSSYAAAAAMQRQFAQIQEAVIVSFQAPPVDGLGSTGGFKLMVRDNRISPQDLQGVTQNLVELGNAQPGLAGLFTSYRADVPQFRIEIDRIQAQTMGVPLSEVFNALQISLGSLYVNDFTYEQRNWQVIIQADAPYRLRPDDIGKIYVRNTQGEMVPLAALTKIQKITGPQLVNRYNLYAAAAINGSEAPGTSTGEAIALVEELAARVLPGSSDIAWTDLSYQQIDASKDIKNQLVFPLAVLFVFLVLAAQYESWSLPLAVILIVPMCILCALIGIGIRGLPNDIFTQISFVVLVGLATKNAILIVEFAKEKREAGASRIEAAVEAARLRLRAILMTALTFILGVVPLVLAEGAGAEMRQAVGTAVFAGMLGVTFFGLLLTPIFFVVVDWLSTLGKSRPTEPSKELTEVTGATTVASS